MKNAVRREKSGAPVCVPGPRAERRSVPQLAGGSGARGRGQRRPDGLPEAIGLAAGRRRGHIRRAHRRTSRHSRAQRQTQEQDRRDRGEARPAGSQEDTSP